MFISRERKKSGIIGTGIQYIPGHIAPFMDFVIENYVPESRGTLLDLGGGGLRFAIPVAILNRKITVIDLDPSGLDLEMIISRIKENNSTELTDFNLLRNNIETLCDNVFDFLKKNRNSYSLITAFRLIHFFNEENINQFFSLIFKSLLKKGKFAVSAISPYEEDNYTYNEFFKYSNAVNKGNEYYRRFKSSKRAKELKEEQNFGEFIHMFSEEYLTGIAKKNKFEIVLSNMPSTRIVRGYVFIK